jgi:cell wall assembly regulator SMI1
MENNNTIMTDAEWLTDEDKEVKKDYLEKVASYTTESKNPESDYSLRQFFDEYTVWYNNLLESSIEDALNPGASKEELDRLEKMIGYLDDDVRELYSLHNGCNGDNLYSMGLFGFDFMSIDEIISNLNGMGRLHDDENDIENSDNKIRANVFNYGWLPIMSDSSGNFIGIDYYPTENGTVGQVINFGRDEQEQYVFASSLKEFLEYLMELTKTEGTFECEEFDGENVLGYNVGDESYMYLTEFLIALKEQE